MTVRSTRRFNEGTLSVLHVCQPVDGGVATYVAALAADHAERGWRVVVACPPSALGDRLSAAGIEHAPWPASRLPGLSTISETSALKRIVQRVEPAVLHLHSATAGLAGRLLRSRPPTIFQPHAWSWDAVAGALRGPVVMWERYATRRCDRIVCVGDAEKERGEAAGLTASWSVIENGVDLDAFSPGGAERRSSARRSLGLGPEPIAVCVGVMRHQKGQDLAIDAWPAVRSARPDATLVLVGGGPEMGHVGARAGDGVRLVGERTDVAEWYAAADVVVVPSRWDGLSLALLEAMASGRSIVASDLPGMRDVVDGGGALFPPGDVVRLGELIIERLTDDHLAETEGLRARHHAEQRFDWRRVTEQMAEVYRQVAGA